MSGKRIYELTEKSNLENDYFMALDKSGTANAQKVNVSKILNPISNISGSSDEYSASKAYTKGDLVIHDNKLYVCNTSCSAAAWSTNQGYFTQSTLATEVTNVKSSLTSKTQSCGNATLEISGNVCILQMNNVEMPGTSSAGFIPAQYCPKTSPVWGAVSHATDSTADARVAIYSNGQFMLQVNGTNTTATVRGQIAWTI